MIIVAQNLYHINMHTYPSLHICVPIQKTPEEVYHFASEPQNLMKWASGLTNAALKKAGDVWVAESPMGKIQIRFVDKNSLGVLDHEVTLSTGETNYNAMRVLKNASGCEVIFTLLRTPLMSDADFKNDSDHVKKDLLRLKSIMESN